jgi:hypothetical protein
MAGRSMNGLLAKSQEDAKEVPQKTGHEERASQQNDASLRTCSDSWGDYRTCIGPLSQGGHSSEECSQYPYWQAKPSH